jgi:2-aminoadipate transaminase
VTLPSPVDTTRLAELSLRAGVAINPGAEWMTNGPSGKMRTRICFAHASEEMLHEGIATVAKVCQLEFGVPTRNTREHR